MVPFHGVPFTWAQFKALVQTTDVAYPRSVNLGHALYCISAFRGWRSVDGVPDTTWIHSTAGSYWCLTGEVVSLEAYFDVATPQCLLPIALLIALLEEAILWRAGRAQSQGAVNATDDGCEDPFGEAERIPISRHYFLEAVQYHVCTRQHKPH